MDKAKFANLAFAGALLAGISYLLGVNTDSEDVTTAMLAWKGAGVWLLAVYVMLATDGTDGGLLTAVLAFCAFGDVLVERDLINGALAFVAAHILAILLYRRNRRSVLSDSQKGLALAVLLLTPMIAWFLTSDILATIYALIVAMMAAAAWTSRFPRYRTGIGAIMFVVSDLLILANEGILDANPLINYLIWSLYFAGQVLIAVGVVETLNGRAGHPQKA